MFSPFVCGSFNHREEDDNMEEWGSPCSTPKRPKKSSCCKSRDSKNPYANRGLDKFTALLAELEDQKQKIYTENGSDDISFVRFAFSNSTEYKPIIVKVKDKKPESPRNSHDTVKDKKIRTNHQELSLDKHVVEPSNPEASAGTENQDQAQRNKLESSSMKKKKQSIWKILLANLRKPSYYLPLIIFMILLLLVMYGRSFAILCTSIGWYAIPIIKGGSSSSSSSSGSKRSKRKKEYARGLSEKKMNVVSDGSSSPTSVINGLKSPRQHGHRRSW